MRPVLLTLLVLAAATAAAGPAEASWGWIGVEACSGTLQSCPARCLYTPIGYALAQCVRLRLP